MLPKRRVTVGVLGLVGLLGIVVLRATGIDWWITYAIGMSIALSFGALALYLQRRGL